MKNKKEQKKGKKNRLVSWIHNDPQPIVHDRIVSMRSVVPINHLASPPLYTRCPCIHTGRVRSVDTTIRTIARDTNRGRGGLNRAVTWTQTRSTASYGRNIRRYCSPRIRAEWKRTRIVVAATTKPASQRSIITPLVTLLGYLSNPLSVLI